MTFKQIARGSIAAGVCSPLNVVSRSAPSDSVACMMPDLPPSVTPMT
jgi:hypothetical protein